MHVPRDFMTRDCGSICWSHLVSAYGQRQCVMVEGFIEVSHADEYVPDLVVCTAYISLSFKQSPRLGGYPQSRPVVSNAHVFIVETDGLLVML
jgi:hypothetical protein